MQLTGAGFDIPDLGTRIRDLNLSGTVQSGHRIRAQGQARIGEGLVDMELIAEWPTGTSPFMDLSLKGQGLRVVDLPDLTVEADPDLRLGLSDQSWSIDGRLGIPKALLKPEAAFVSKVQESEDVILVNEAPEQVLAKRNDSGWPVKGDLELSLGKDVNLEADLASLSLRGNLALNWARPPGTLRPGRDPCRWINHGLGPTTACR